MFVGIGVGVGRQRFSGGFADSYSARVLSNGGTIESLSCVAGASALLQQASLLFIPSGYKAGVAFSALPNNGNGDLTWTRNSTANRTNSSGLISSVGANVPRLSYMYGSCPSALLEPQRTNLFLRSELFSDSVWTKTRINIIDNSTTSPDGTSDASTFEGNGVSGSKFAIQSISVTSGLNYTLSIYAKKNTNDFLQITGSATIFSATYFANFDLNNGVLGTIGSGVTATITNVGNGWYRCTMTATASSTGTNTVGIYLISSATATRAEANLLTTSVYIWGSQFEQGAYATTYIPTTTATSTRLADTFSRNNIYTNGLISASGGTWYVELKNNVAYVRDASGGGFGINTNVNSLTTDNGFTIRNAGGGSSRLTIFKVISGTNTILYTTTTDTTKIAIKWNGSTADVFVNGTKQVSATVFTSTLLEFFNSSTIDVPKFIQAMALFSTPLSDTDCATLTT